MSSKPVTGDRSDSCSLIARKAATNPRAHLGIQGLAKARCLYSHIVQSTMPVLAPEVGSLEGGPGEVLKEGGGGQPPADAGKGPVTN